MRTKYRNLALKFSMPIVIVGALFLASCSGGGGGPVTSNGGGTTTPTPDPKDPTPLADAVDARADAAAASTAASGHLKAATDAEGKRDTASVSGDSQMAYDNVMTVLGARALIKAESEKAASAVATLTGIDDSGMSDAEKARIAALLSDAKKDQEAIDAILEAEADETGSLAAAEHAIRGTSEDSDAKLAQSAADAVSTAITTAIGNFPGASNESFGNYTWSGTTGSSSGDIMSVGKSGKTFKDITGMDRMAVTDTDDFTADGTAALDISSANTLGANTTADYKGIPGTVLCKSASCTAGTDGTVTGTMEFIPTDDAAIYTGTVAGGYTKVTNAASYGYWLNTAGTEIDAHVDSSTTASGLDWSKGTSASAVKATYSGKAGGYSVKTTGTGAAATTASGEFTADVELRATFDSAASIGGSISNFAAKAGSDGNGHVNANWVIALTKTGTFSDNFDDGSVGTDAAYYRNGEAGATGGAWSAVPYGAAGKNPSGFVGAFEATFTDGSAAGVYGTE